jgi:hypothetical protein
MASGDEFNTPAKRGRRRPRKAPRPGGVRFGDPMLFRGFLHAPVNEIGVVCLFGALAEDLGYRIESVGHAFPDCVAKQLTDVVSGVWEDCRIEFEFRSSNFDLHGHDASGCDLLVCWENDWKRPRVDVLELKRVVEAFRVGEPVGVYRGSRAGTWLAVGRVGKWIEEAVGKRASRDGAAGRAARDTEQNIKTA